MTVSDTQRNGVQAIAQAFERAAGEGRAALVAYLTVGYPTPEATPGLVNALVEGGADIIELGVPFSDPVADGPTIQAASYAALAQGVTPESCLESVRALRESGVTTPILLMGYYNPVFSYGQEHFVEDCRRCGVDGLILPDLPPEEAAELSAACADARLALVYLVAPTTSEERIAEICQATSGFVYVVRRLGTTGADEVGQGGLTSRAVLSAGEPHLSAARRHARTPVALGFGISTADQVAQAAAQADGVIIGSAIVGLATEGPGAVKTYLEAIRPGLSKR